MHAKEAQHTPMMQQCYTHLKVVQLLGFVDV